MSNEAVSNQEHNEKIVHLKKQMSAIKRKQAISYIIILIGVALIYSLFDSIEKRGISGLNFAIEASFTLTGVVSFILGFFIHRYCAIKLDPLEKEFSEIATREDWLKKTN